jgi:hypothetical protein
MPQSLIDWVGPVKTGTRRMVLPQQGRDNTLIVPLEPNHAPDVHIANFRRPVMESRITGTTMPVLEFLLNPNESIISEAGELSWMGSSIQMTTHTQFAGGGGLFGVLKRVAGGGSIFMTEYRALGSGGAQGMRQRIISASTYRGERHEKRPAGRKTFSRQILRGH